MTMLPLRSPTGFRITRPATATPADDAARRASQLRLLADELTPVQARVLCHVLAARDAAKTARVLEAAGYPEHAKHARALRCGNMEAARRIKAGL